MKNDSNIKVNQLDMELREKCKNGTASDEEKEQLRILHLRYGSVCAKQRPDFMMQALLSLRTIEPSSNSLKEKIEYQKCVKALQDLGVYEEPHEMMKANWKDLLKSYMQLSQKSFSRPAFLGMGKRDDETVSYYVNKEMQKILFEIPEHYHLSEHMEAIQSVAKELMKV